MKMEMLMDSQSEEITDVLGRVRTVEKVYPDGSWNCPFCFSAVGVDRDVRDAQRHYTGGGCGKTHCQNPACFANPHYPPDRARAEVAAAEARAREEASRKEVHRWAMARAEEARQARAAHKAEVRAEAEKRGACVSCALHSLRFGAAVAKFTKHRAVCPRV